MIEKKYNGQKKVTLIEVAGAFINYTMNTNLTRSEYLLAQNVYDFVMEKLNESDNNDRRQTIHK